MHAATLPSPASLPATSPRSAALRRIRAEGTPQHLSDAELVAGLLGVSLAAADAALTRAGSLRALAQMDPGALALLDGLGGARACTLLAAVELGRRSLKPGDARPRLRTPREIFDYLAPALSALRREVFHVLCLNSRNTLVADVRVAEGGTASCPVDPREVFGAALRSGCVAVVLAHNHPSGDPEPSVQDVELTRQLCEGARLLGLSVLDHVIVGDGAFASLLERGLLPLPTGGGRWAAQR